MFILSCRFCAVEFEAKTDRRSYCSRRCADKGKPSASGLTCCVCGGDMVRGASSAPQGVARHSKCANVGHGTRTSYAYGCRCDLCRAAQTDALRKYAEKRKKSGKPIIKPTVPRDCEQCGESFPARVDQIKRGGGKFCSIKCGNTFKSHSQQRYIDGSEKREALQSRWREFGKQGSVRWRALRRARAALELSGGKRVFVNGPCLVCKEEFTAAGVSARYCSRECRELNLPDKFGASWLDRMWLYARDNWECHLCGLEVAYGVESDDPRAATLDHLVPQAAGGSHDFENLRTCHSLCNSIRRDLPVSMFRSVEAVSMLRSRLLEALGVAA